MKFMDFFTIDVWTIIFTWVNMFILYNVVNKILYKPVTQVLRQREEEVKKMYSDAATVQESADSLKKEYDEKLANAREEAGRIIKSATVSAQRREEEIIRAAHNEAANITDRAQREMARERKKVYRDIQSEIADISTAIAGKMVQREINAADHEELIKQFIENVGEE